MFDYGLGPKDGTAHFYPPANTEHVSRSLVFRELPRRHHVEIQVKRLATIVGELGHRRADLLKMDGEGPSTGSSDCESRRDV